MAGAALSALGREEIRVGCDRGETFTAIALALGRAPSTISQEVGRNGGRHRYCAVAAGARAVSELARAGGVDGGTVSPGTIYQAVSGHGRRGLAAGLARCLHRKRRRRKRRCRDGEQSKKAGPLGVFNLIGLRPEIASGRYETGHFEGDLIIGARGASAIVTIIDRASRYNLIGDLPEGHDATSVLACCIELLERVPVELRRPLTWDQGTEMARHDDLAAAVGIDVFFA